MPKRLYFNKFRQGFFVILLAIAFGTLLAGTKSDPEVIDTIAFDVAPKLNYNIPVDSMAIRVLGGKGRCFVISFESSRNEFLEVFYIGFLLGGLAAMNAADPILHTIVRITIQYKKPETKFWIAKSADTIRLLNKEITVQEFINSALIKI